MVMRNVTGLAPGATAGPFFSKTGVNFGDAQEDPAVDTKDWAYCCGTATLGYTYPSTTGTFNGTIGSGTALRTYDSTQFNVNDAFTYSMFTVNVTSLTGTSSTVSSYCYVNLSGSSPGSWTSGQQNIFNSSFPQYANTPQCNNNAPSGTLITSTSPLAGNIYQTTITVNNPAGTVTFSIQKNCPISCQSTGLTVSANATGTLIVHSNVSFAAGDYLSFVLSNTSSNAATVSGNWSIQ